MSSRITNEEASLAQSFFEELINGIPVDPFTFPTVPLTIDSSPSAQRTEKKASMTFFARAHGFVRAENSRISGRIEHLRNPFRELSPSKEGLDLAPTLIKKAERPFTLDRKLSLRKAGALNVAKKIYAEMTTEKSTALKAKKALFALKHIEKGLKIGKPTSLSQFSLIGLEAKIRLDIFENGELANFLISNPEQLEGYCFTHMNFEVVESMVEKANAQLEELPETRPSRSKSYLAESAFLLQRIESIRKRTIAPTPSVQPIEIKDRNREEILDEIVIDLGEEEDSLPPTQTDSQKVLAEVKKNYQRADDLVNEEDRLMLYALTLSLIEEGLKAPNLPFLDKAALILKKSQILFKLGNNRIEIQELIVAIQKEIDDAPMKKVPWKSLIYPLNILLADIKREQEQSPSRKRKLIDEFDAILPISKKARHTELKK